MATRPVARRGSCYGQMEEEGSQKASVSITLPMSSVVTSGTIYDSRLGHRRPGFEPCLGQAVVT